ncbi:MAG TPA: hypothetical protein VMM76_02125 [Pirellulaceae bacterium]|nr:hypothetical protein [Pirellulaceae bacterium]
MYAQGRNPLVGLLALVAALIIGFVGISYAMGWLEFHNEANRTTIEFDKNEAQDDTERAIERTQDFIKDTGKTLQDAGSSLQDDDASPQDNDDSDVFIETTPPENLPPSE